MMVEQEKQSCGARVGAAHVLSNGRYATLLTPAGGGYSALDGFAITRWVPDPSQDGAGFRLYVCDVERGSFFGFGGGAGVAEHARFDAATAELSALCDGIDARLTIAVDASHDAELRRLVLHNASDVARTLEVTTCAELSLNTPAADAAHPAFSKLFVQTAHVPERNALLAWRRPRSPDDRPLWSAHALLTDQPLDGSLQFETDRMRFVGRGRDMANPIALHGQLTGTTGSVLDPVFALRARIRLEPGATASFVALLAAAGSREVVLRTIAAFPHVAAAGAAIADAAAPHRDSPAALGLPRRWRESLDLHVGTAAEYRLPGRAATACTNPAPPAPAQPGDDLHFFNGWGGFAPAADEYVIRLGGQHGAPRRPPLPWVNVMANEEAGCIVSESGAIYTWAANSRENRLTPWFNDPVTDPHGEAFYIRDEDSGAMWSPTPGPLPGNGDYEVRHGFGCTRFTHSAHGIATVLDVFVPGDAPARVARLALANRTDVPRRLRVCSYAQLVLGAHEADTRGRVETWCDTDGTLFARNPDRGEFSGRVAFAAVAGGEGAADWTTDRREFLGTGGVALPAGVAAARLRQRSGTDIDPCFAASRVLELAAGGSAVIAFVLGEAADADAARQTAARFSTVRNVDAAYEAARQEWRVRVGTVRIATPSPALDVMVNGWLTYQNLCCRMWARSAYYQSGGAYGFRDQLQDSSALLYIDPEFTRSQILLHAAHQFVEGDVLHWWHPPRSKGIRTRFSDDLLWLPYVTMFYIGATGDRALLDEEVGFVTAPALQPGEDEEFLVPGRAAATASLYEHCCRALDRSLTKGAHGLPLMGVGDWNDGMNRVGRQGRGESVWLGFFLYDILRDFIPVCAQRGDAARATAYVAYREHLGRALNEAGWDGEWYRRAYYDSGEPLGSARSDECRIDALAQAWAVLSGAAPADRANSALDALETHLVSEEEGLIRLLAPPFDRTPHDPGYIKGYIPGVRENGGQYTHGVLWAVRALAQAGRSERAAKLLEMLSPATRGGTAEHAARYMVEPYVIAADVYGVEPHVGRGGWTWYTGSAGWMYRVALESVLGVTLHDGNELRLQPCIPSDWPGFSVTIRRPDGTTYEIQVERGAPELLLDGNALDVSEGMRVPLTQDGRTHHVRARWPR